MVQHLCSYGCGKLAQYFVTKKSKPCCSEHFNKCEALRKRNSNGLKGAYKNGKHRTVWTDEYRQHAVAARHERVLEDLRSDNAQYRSNMEVKKMIKQYNLLPYKCARCEINSWNNESIVLELDHIDGDAFNCSLSNYRYLCPNCHSQTHTYRGRTINTGKKKVSDEALIEAIKETDNLRQALIKVGLSPRGGNYARAAKLAMQTKS
jgi:hypothetical protein